MERVLEEATKGPITIEIERGAKAHEVGEGLREFCQAWARCSTDVTLVERETSKRETTTLLLRSRDGTKRFLYSLVPEGPELRPFARLVERLTAEDEDKGADPGFDLDEVKETVRMQVLAAPGCPNCPLAVGAAIDVALACPRADLDVIDVLVEPELTKELSMSTVPITLIENELIIDRVVTAREVARHVRSRGTQEFRDEVFRSLVKRGRHEQAAERIEQHYEIFIDWWLRSTMSERIALMLVAEEVLEANPTMLDPVIERLLPVLGGDDASLRGDTADLLGKTGNLIAREPMERLLEDPVSDVVEVAEEALEELEERLVQRQVFLEREG